MDLRLARKISIRVHFHRESNNTGLTGGEAPGRRDCGIGGLKPVRLIGPEGPAFLPERLDKVKCGSAHNLLPFGSAAAKATRSPNIGPCPSAMLAICSHLSTFVHVA